MVSIEPADKTADGVNCLVYRDGKEEKGRVFFQIDGENALLLKVETEEPGVADALIRAMLNASDLQGARTAVCTELSYSTLLSSIGFVKSDKEMRLSLRVFFNHPCHR